MNTSNVLKAGVVLAVAFSLIAIVRGGSQGPAGLNGQNGNDGQGQVLGATPTLDGVDNPYVTINGQREWHGSVGLSATSSTICSIRNPFNSTSTVDRAGLKVLTGMVGANSVSLSTSTNTYATSTDLLVLDKSIPTNTTGVSFFWTPGISTTSNIRILPSNAPDGSSNVVLGPGEYLNWRLATTTGAGALAAYYTGSCSAVVYGN